MIELFHSQRYWMAEIAGEMELTPQMCHALHEIPAEGGITMSALADEIACDASNATGIVDRLESRGLVERRPSDQDRRMKCVLLTPAGKRLRKKIEGRFGEAPPAIAALSAADQRTLREILERALAHAAEQRLRGTGT